MCSWLGLIGQFRPKKLISSIKGEFTNADEFEWPAFKDVAKHVFDKSIYSLGLFSQISLSSSSVLLSTERHGDKRRPRYKMMLWHEVFGFFFLHSMSIFLFFKLSRLSCRHVKFCKSHFYIYRYPDILFYRLFCKSI